MSEYRSDFREVQREAFWSLPRVAAFLLAAIMVLYGIGFVATGGELAIYSFWAPKMANAQRQVFVNTQSYVEGKTDYMSKLRYDYEMAEPARKAALKTLILSEAVSVDMNKMPADLQAFVQSLK